MQHTHAHAVCNMKHPLHYIPLHFQHLDFTISPIPVKQIERGAGVKKAVYMKKKKPSVSSHRGHKSLQLAGLRRLGLRGAALQLLQSKQHIATHSTQIHPGSPRKRMARAPGCQISKHYLISLLDLKHSIHSIHFLYILESYHALSQTSRI